MLQHWAFFYLPEINVSGKKKALTLIQAVNAFLCVH